MSMFRKSAPTTLRKMLLYVAAIAVAGLMTVPAAHADAIYNLTYDGCSGGCGPQNPFGTVNLHQVDSNTVELTVSLLNNNKFVTTGSHTGFAFNFQGGAVSYGTLPTGWSIKGANNEPGFGSFTGGIDCNKGNSNSANSCAGNNPWVGDLTFDVSRASGLSIDDFVINGSGKVFATDIISGTTGETGLVAADGNQSPVPEPATLAMLGTGVLGFAGVLRRKLVR
jgi:hypothetical protein